MLRSISLFRVSIRVVNSDNFGKGNKWICCNERLSIFNQLFTTFLESELESVTQKFRSLTTPSKEKDEGQPSLILNFILFTED